MPRKKFTLKQFFLTNLETKLFTLLLALMIWFILYQQEDIQVQRRLRVILDPPTGYVMLSQATQESADEFEGEVLLTIAGQKQVVEAVRDQQPVTVSVPKSGVVDFRDIKTFGFKSLTITDASPRGLNCAIEAETTQTFDVLVETSGKPSIGKNVREKIADPGQVTLAGPVGAFESVKNPSRVVKARLDISNISTSDKREVEFTIDRSQFDSRYHDFVRLVETSGTVSIRVESSSESFFVAIPLRCGVRVGYGVPRPAPDILSCEFEGPPGAADEVKRLVEQGLVAYVEKIGEVFSDPTFSMRLPKGVRFITVRGDANFRVEAHPSNPK